METGSITGAAPISDRLVRGEGCAQGPTPHPPPGTPPRPPPDPDLPPPVTEPPNPVPVPPVEPPPPPVSDPPRNVSPLDNLAGKPDWLYYWREWDGVLS